MKSDTDTQGGQESDKPLGLQRTECWRCGYERLIFESCPECGGSCKPLKMKKQQQSANNSISDTEGDE